MQIWDDMFGSLINWFSIVSITPRDDKAGGVETGRWRPVFDMFAEAGVYFAFDKSGRFSCCPRLAVFRILQRHRRKTRRAHPGRFEAVTRPTRGGIAFCRL